MRTAGVREARQDLTSLLDDVRKGREVVITDRGRPVARLVPVRAPRPFPDLKKLRSKANALARARISQALLEDREDRM
jgi:prevent-host-death family protein